MQKDPSSATSMQWWANGYARCGWRVFPVVGKEKRPLYSGWQKDATTDAEMVKRYWPEGLDRNIGIVCGEEFDAWDIEVQHLDAFTAWLETNAYILPETPIATTGRGGIHILTEPTGVNHTRKLYLDGTHIGELKSTGGFILACPSVTEGDYYWRWAPDYLAVQPAPAWLLGLLERPQTAVHKFKDRLTSPADVIEVLGRLAGSVEHAGEGKRNDYLYWATRRAIEEGVPVRHVVTAFAVAGQEAGLTAHEVDQTIRSAIDAEGLVAA